jgi:hypothetical protein
MQRFANSGSGCGERFLAESKLAPDLLRVLEALMGWFDQARIPSVIIGGVAASVLGKARVTGDVDAVVLVADDGWTEFLTSGHAFGFEPRIPDPLQFALRTRVLLLRYAPLQIDVDVSLGALPFESEMIAAAQTLDIDGVRVRFPRVEDLIVMKAVAHRDVDRFDIEWLLKAHPNINLAKIRETLTGFAEALEQPELLATFERIVAAQQKKQPPD